MFLMSNVFQKKSFVRVFILLFFILFMVTLCEAQRKQLYRIADNIVHCLRRNGQFHAGTTIRKTSSLVTVRKNLVGEGKQIASELSVSGDLHRIASSQKTTRQNSILYILV